MFEFIRRLLLIDLQFHWQFHPAAHLFREILDSGRYGRILRTNAVMTASPGVPDGDIRWQFELSGKDIYEYNSHNLQDLVTLTVCL